MTVGRSLVLGDKEKKNEIRREIVNDGEFVLCL